MNEAGSIDAVAAVLDAARKFVNLYETEAESPAFQALESAVSRVAAGDTGGAAMKLGQLGKLCLLCERPVHDGDTTLMPLTDGKTGEVRLTHRACMLREVTGGIGHVLAHEHWCVERGDPDAGLERWQSAALVSLLVDMGVDVWSRT